MHSTPFPDLQDIKALSHVAKILAAIKERQKGSKGLPAKGGWVYLINDTNQFLEWQFGLRSWTDEDRVRVHEIFSERNAYFTAHGTPYMMVITPEKSVAYREWLPDELATLKQTECRPAAYLSDAFGSMVSYPLNHLQQMKRHGLLFYRGDSHVNWLGAFHLYHHSIEAACDRGFDLGPALPLSAMNINLASWQGDLLIQIPETLQAEFEADAALWRPMIMEESLVQFTLHPDLRRSWRLPEPDVFRIGRPERETIVTQNADRRLPRALIFRDSTATLMIDLLAEHFSRAVFIWHDADLIAELVEQERPDVVLHFKAERFLATCPTMPAVSRGIVTTAISSRQPHRS